MNKAIVIEVASSAPIDDRSAALGVFYDSEARCVQQCLICCGKLDDVSPLRRLHWSEMRAKLGGGFDVRVEALVLSETILRRAKAAFDLDRKSRRLPVSRVSKVSTPPGSPVQVCCLRRTRNLTWPCCFYL